MGDTNRPNSSRADKGTCQLVGEVAAYEAMPSSDNRSALLGFVMIGIAAYLVYLVVIAIYHLAVPPPRISLAVSAWFEPPPPQENRQLRIAGAVIENDKPANQGRIRLSVEDWKKGMRQSLFVDAKDGHFESGDQPALRSFTPGDRLRILAEYEKSGAAATDEVYLGARIPHIGSRTAIVVSVGAVFVMLGFLWLFTGPPVPGKNTWAIIVSYVVMIVFLGIPLIMPDIVSILSPETMAAMQETPVGILVADLGKGELGRQWVLNIGGTVDAVPVVTSDTTLSAHGQQNSTVPSGVSDAQSTEATARSELTAQEPSSSSAVSVRQAPQDNSVLSVHGGLAVPLYVLILSLIGAAINMTRKLPDFQKEAATLSVSPPRAAANVAAQALAAVSQALSATMSKDKKRDVLAVPAEQKTAEEPDAPAAGVVDVQDAPDPQISGETEGERLLRVTGEWRKGLITQHMYLLSAPFLAVAVYYLLAWLELLKTPVLVLVSFSVGLISDKILGRILGIAGDIVNTAQPSTATN